MWQVELLKPFKRLFVRNARVEVIAEREQVDRREFTGTDTTTEVTAVQTTVRETGSRFIPPHLHHVVEEEVDVEEEDGIQLHNLSWYLEILEYSYKCGHLLSDKDPNDILLFSNSERWKMEYQLRRSYLLASNNSTFSNHYIY